MPQIPKKFTSLKSLRLQTQTEQSTGWLYQLVRRRRNSITVVKSTKKKDDEIEKNDQVNVDNLRTCKFVFDD